MSFQKKAIRSMGAILDFWISRGSDAQYAKRYNLLKPLRPGKATDIAFHEDTGLFELTQADDKLYVARRSRLFYQFLGLSSRQQRLLRDYMLDDFTFGPDDLVIDCGANIGEVSVALAKLGANVLAYEPHPVEYKALKANADMFPNMEALNLALWKESSEMVFYAKNDTADSSLIDPGDAQRELRVQTISLDEFMKGRPEEGKRIRVIKLEAEGAEPEIIEGMKETLSRVDCLTVDMGPERGSTSENTVAQVCELLWDHGFKLERFNHNRVSGLFVARDRMGALS